MPWNPETPLTNDAISLTKLEESSMKLWNEFLCGYFDGGTHEIGGVATQFPQATIVHQRAEHDKQGIFIHIVALDVSAAKLLNSSDSGSVRKLRTKVKWMFGVKCLSKNNEAGNSEYLARNAADRLLALLTFPGSTAPLARKGISCVRATTSKLVNSPDWAIRGLDVTAYLQAELPAAEE